MSKRIILLFSFFFISCSEALIGEDPSTTAISTFEEFWKGVDATWPEFESKHINWDSVYAIYRPRLNDATNDAQLKVVLSDMLQTLTDSHTSIYPTDQSVIQYYPAWQKNFYGLPWIKKNYLNTYSGNKALAYGLLTPQIGYIYIGTFGNDLDQYQIMDEILSSFKSVKGIIIDVRNNTGGGSNRSEAIASHFTEQSTTYSYSRFRINKERMQMGDYIAEHINSSSGIIFTGKVAVLTNKYSFSATEDFLLMMKSFPQVIQVGDFTGGGSGTRPLFKELPNGWLYRVSSKQLCDLNKRPIRYGISPDLYVTTTRADSLLGKDTILERAMIELVK